MPERSKGMSQPPIGRIEHGSHPWTTYSIDYFGDSANALGESPVWDAARRMLWWSMRGRRCAAARPPLAGAPPPSIAPPPPARLLPTGQDRSGAGRRELDRPGPAARPRAPPQRRRDQPRRPLHQRAHGAPPATPPASCGDSIRMARPRNCFDGISISNATVLARARDVFRRQPRGYPPPYPYDR